MAVNRNQYARVIDQNVLPVSNGLFVPGSPYYSPTSYPAYNPTQAKSLVQAGREAERRPDLLHVRLDQLAGRHPVRRSTSSRPGSAVGFQVKTTIVEQNQTINNALAGEFQALGWRQFGAVDPDLNYIFWSTTTVSSGALSINMARNADPTIEQALLAGRASTQPSVRGGGLQDGQQAPRPRPPLPVAGPGGLGGRRYPEGAEFQQPDHAAGSAGLWHDRGFHLAHTDLDQLSWRLMSGRILVVEDDERIRSSMRLALEGEGYEVKDAASGEEGLDLFAEAPTDVALIDLMLPGMDGFECCRALRRSSAVPIIIVTARSDTHDVVAGLEAGADDYVTKPFVAKELAARIRALLRRARPAEEEPGALTFGDLQLLPEQGVLRRLNGDEVHCTRTEFRLLCELAASPNKVLSREQLLDRVWGYDYFGDGRLVDVHIRRLRTKVEADPAVPQHILTVRGMGYKLVP